MRPTRDAVAEALRSIERAEGRTPRCTVAAVSAEFEQRMAAAAYRDSGLQVYDALLFDADHAVDVGPCVPILAYRDLDIEFHRARDYGARLGRRLKSMRRAVWAAAVAAAFGWVAVAILWWRYF